MDLIKYIFTIPGVKSFLSEHISQDPQKSILEDNVREGE